MTKRPRIMFDHLPKCAGTSVQSLLARLYPAERIAPFVSTFSASTSLRLYTQYDVVCGHFSGRVALNAPFPLKLITVVRDPVERVLSYFHYIRGLEAEGGASELLRGMELEDFVRSRSVAAGAIPNWFCIHFADSIGNVTSADDLLPQALTALDYYDLIGICEDIDQTAKRIVDLCGGDESGIGHDNVTEGRPRREEIDPATIRAIETTNSLDVEFYKRAQERFYEGVRPSRSRAELASELAPDHLNFGTREVVFEDVGVETRLAGADDGPVGDVLDVHFTLVSAIDEPDLAVVLLVKNELGDIVFGWNSSLAGDPVAIAIGERRGKRIETQLNVGNGSYSVSLVAYPAKRFADKIYYHWIEPAATINVQSTIDVASFGAVKQETRMIREPQRRA